jgi:hypothetical protein
VTRHVPRHIHGVFSLRVAEAGVRIARAGGEVCHNPGVDFVSELARRHAGNIPAGASYQPVAADKSGAARGVAGGPPGRGATAAHFPVPLVRDGELPAYFRPHRAGGVVRRHAGQGVPAAGDLSLLVGRHSAERDIWPETGDETGRCGGVRLPADCCHENVSSERWPRSRGSVLSPLPGLRRVVGVPRTCTTRCPPDEGAGLLARGKRIVSVRWRRGSRPEPLHRAFKRKFGVTPRQYLG